jgi:hypothetical protein
MQKQDATFEDGVALYLPGILGGHAAHFAGGRVRRQTAGDGELPGGVLALERPASRRSTGDGYLFSRGRMAIKQARGEHLGIGGTYRADLAGKLILFNGNERNEVLAGRTSLALRAWHHVTLVREGAKCGCISTDGQNRKSRPSSRMRFHPVTRRCSSADAMTAIWIRREAHGVFRFSRALPAAEIAALYQHPG